MKKHVLLVGLMLSTLAAWAGNPSEASLVVTSISNQFTGMSCGSHFAACTLELCKGIPKTGVVTIQNQSPSTAYNIQATVPSSFGNDLSVSSNTCSTVLPGGTCQITLLCSPTSAGHPLTDMTIQGSNTKPVTVTVSLDVAVFC